MYDLRQPAARAALEPYMGSDYQLCGTRHYRLSGGAGNGCRCIDVRTGSGFDYTVVCDRGMDLSLASFRGVNLTFLTAAAETHPAFCDPWENEWLRTFSGGLLTTCGPCHLGPPCEDGGERLGLHGRWSGLPARQVCDATDFPGGEIAIDGTLHESAVFGPKLRIRRSIRSPFGEARVTVEDTICNLGGDPAPLTVLYHVNLGFPLLCEDAVIRVSSDACVGYDEDSARHLAARGTVLPPDGSHREKNYLHTFAPGANHAAAWLWNRKLCGGLAVCLRWSPREMPYMTQWMLENRRDYVAALEPANVPCESRDVLRRQGRLPMLAPGETRRFRLELQVLAGNEAIARAIAASGAAGAT